MQVKNTQKLKSLRAKIDLIDSRIKKILTERFKTVLQIAKYKKANNLTTFDKKRETEILDKIEDSSQKAIFKQILKESRKEQTRQIND